MGRLVYAGVRLDHHLRKTKVAMAHGEERLSSPSTTTHHADTSALLVALLCRSYRHAHPHLRLLCQPKRHLLYRLRHRRMDVQGYVSLPRPAVNDLTDGTLFTLVTDMIGTCASSMILALRTTAVWRQQKVVSIPLAIASVVQIVLWGQTMRYSKSVWNAQRQVCQIEQTSPVPLLIGVWTYSKCSFGACLCVEFTC